MDRLWGSGELAARGDKGANVHLSGPSRPSFSRIGELAWLRGLPAGALRKVGLVALMALLLATVALAMSVGPFAARASGALASAEPWYAAGTTTTKAEATSQTSAPTAGVPSGLVPPGASQTPLNPGWKTDRIDIRVMPEYDEKAVLVIMGFSLPADVTLPATLRFALPSGARITGIGEVDPAGNFVYNYTTTYPPIQPGTPWDVATIEVKTYRQLQIDYYYDPGLPEAAGQRSFPLLVQLPMDASTVILHVQHPVRATDFKAEPALSGSGQAGDGFTYSVATFADVKAGSTLGYTISYYKPDGALSIDAEGTDGNSQGQPASVDTNTVLLTAILVVVVIVGGLVVYRLFLAPRGSVQRPDRSNALGALRSASRKTPPKASGRQRKGTRDAPTGRGKPAQTATTPAAPQEAGATAPRPAARRATSPATASRAQEPTRRDDERVPESEAEAAAIRAETPAYCVACGEELSPASPFCPRCGEAQP